jgi:uncharacterized membrane protein
MWEYVIPVIVFLTVYLVIYNLKDKEKEKDINVQAIAPAAILGVLVFAFMKYRHNFMTDEPTMGGNYFE